MFQFFPTLKIPAVAAPGGPRSGGAARWASRSPACLVAACLTLMSLASVVPAAPVRPEAVDEATGIADVDRDGVEDLLQRWRRGEHSFDDLRRQATVSACAARAAAALLDGAPAAADGAPAPGKTAPTADGPWARGHLRLLCLDATPSAKAASLEAAGRSGLCRTLFATSRFGGVTVVEVDEAGLRALVDAPPPGRLLLDRDGVPALAASRRAVGVNRVETGAWHLGDDASSALAILDSGCDTAHGDLGDASDDDRDGPPPAVGDAEDWYSAANGWPLSTGYKVIGWHDVTDDFPAAAGPWDYHHHGTALASVAAGSGVVAATGAGVARGARLAIVKCYDFDEVWHVWAGDFLAACAWILEQRQTLRIGPVLMAVNWDAELGLTGAMDELAAAGLTPVSAMGNFGGSGAIGWPARLPTVLTVGAVNDAGAVAAFSGRGGLVATKPDLVAPGGGLLSAAGRIECADNEPNDSYSGRWGTSLAAAHVAGALHLLDEALAEQAVDLPRGLTAVRTRQAVLRLTAAPVAAAETDDGLGSLPLPVGTAPRDDCGWGLLRIDAAVQALLVPLRPGLDQIDSLLAGGQQPVVARRLDLQPNVHYLVEALPAPGMDIELVVADPRDLDTDRTGAAVLRHNQGGAGTSEFTYLQAGADSWRLLAVKLLSGDGAVVLRLREASSFVQQGAWRQLPGALTGYPASGSLAAFSGPSFVVPSLVASDPAARSVNVLAADGSYRPGWPVFVFPHPSAQGGLNLPLVWDLDGIAGDEIVASSGYGSVYFFNGSGSYQTVNLAFNRGLTAPVGYETVSGQRRVMVVDDLGNARAWRHGAVLEASVSLGHAAPLPPAVGVLTVGAGAAIVVAFADGTVTALDGQLAALPGWPRQLGATPASAPVLCDLDGDAGLEVIVPVFSGDRTSLVFHVLDGTGASAVGDGALAAAPTGGSWLGLSWPAVPGRPGAGDLGVGLVGLVSNGQAGDQATWNLGEVRLTRGGTSTVRTVPGLQVQGTSDQGELILNRQLLAPPLAWDHRGDWGTDLASLVHLSWSELFYGLSSTPGATTGWFVDTGDDEVLAVRRPTLSGGSAAGSVSAIGAAIARVNDELLLRIDVQDRLATITPVVDSQSLAPLWGAARGDGRNSGAYTLAADAAPVSAVTAPAGVLQVQPNPGSGRFRFRATGADAPVVFEIFDLRGRRVRALDRSDGDRSAGDQAAAAWDGCGDDGRPLPAGTYLVRARGAGARAAARLTIVR